MKKPIVILVFLLSTVIGLAIIQVVVSTSLSTTGIELSDLQGKIKTYKKENSLLLEKFLVRSSLTQIASVSSELGFAEPHSAVYLTSFYPVALKR